MNELRKIGYTPLMAISSFIRVIIILGTAPSAARPTSGLPRRRGPRGLTTKTVICGARCTRKWCSRRPTLLPRQRLLPNTSGGSAR